MHDEKRQFLLAVHRVGWALRNNRAVSRPLKRPFFRNLLEAALDDE